MKKVFKLKLGKEYFNKGIIQIPKKYENEIPKDKGIKVRLLIQNESNIIYPTFTFSGHNRKINGKSELKDWLQSNFNLNDEVDVEIISETEFRIFK